jgi:hypothetical protein
MTRNLWLSLTTSFLVALCISLSAQEKKEREPKKKGPEAAESAVKGKEKAAAEVVAKEAEVKKPVANPEDVEAFRKRRDPDALEIVALYQEVDKGYTDLRTAMNVATGDDKEAKKAKTEVKALESKVKRQLRKLQDKVEKLAKPFDKIYEEAKRNYDLQRDRAKQLEEQGQEKKATAYYQRADRFTGQMEGAKRQGDTLRFFLYFESAEGLDLGNDVDDAKGGGKGAARDDKGGK